MVDVPDDTLRQGGGVSEVSFLGIITLKKVPGEPDVARIGRSESFPGCRSHAERCSD